MRFLFYLFLCFSISIHDLQSQNQITALPLKYNPANAGFSGTGRLAIYAGAEKQSSRKDEEHIPKVKPFYSSAISYDQFIEKISTGIGFQASYMREPVSPGEYNYASYLNTDFIPYQYISYLTGYNFLAAISPKISFQGKYTLAPGFSFEYSNYNVVSKFSSLYLYPEANYNIEKYRYTAGILLNTKNYYLGYSCQLLNKLKGNYNEGSYKTSYSTFQAGCVFKRSNKSKFIFTPALMLRVRNFDIEGYKKISLLLNINFKYKKIIWGVLPGIMLGYQTERLSALFNYAPITLEYEYNPMEFFGKFLELNFKYKIITSRSLTQH